jgi:sulfite oxidase
MTDVKMHKFIPNRVWVTYKDSVYDITEFLRVHPGGSDKLMMAAGGSIEGFWELYRFHKNEAVYELLEKFKIGILHEDDRMRTEDIPDYSELKDEIERSKDLMQLSEMPFCAETNSKYYD